MTIKEPRSLYKEQKPVTVPISAIIIASIAFALAFFVIGSIFRHYPIIGA